MFQPRTPGRIRDTYARLDPHLPKQLRFVVILREPVSRAISSFWYKGGHSAAEAVKDLSKQMASRHSYDNCTRHRRAEAVHFSRPLTPVAEALACRPLSYWSVAGDFNGRTDHVEKGMYAAQLKRWFSVFPSCQFYISSMERLYRRDGDAASFTKRRGLSEGPPY